VAGGAEPVHASRDRRDPAARSRRTSHRRSCGPRLPTMKPPARGPTPGPSRITCGSPSACLVAPAWPARAGGFSPLIAVFRPTRSARAFSTYRSVSRSRWAAAFLAVRFVSACVSCLSSGTVGIRPWLAVDTPTGPHPPGSAVAMLSPRSSLSAMRDCPCQGCGSRVEDGLLHAPPGATAGQHPAGTMAR
jgi:hypothetical protein